jgi:hypothetical protein
VEIKGGPIEESAAEAEKIKKQMISFGKIFDHSSRLMSNYKVVCQQVDTNKKNGEQAKIKRKKAEKKKEELQSLQQEQPEGVSGDAMEEALAALGESEEALQDAEDQLCETLQIQKEREEEMQKSEEILKNAQKNPEKIEDFASSLEN